MPACQLLGFPQHPLLRTPPSSETPVDDPLGGVAQRELFHFSCRPGFLVADKRELTAEKQRYRVEMASP